ncbi:MAG: hypothetical protein IJF03_01880 [Lachnospiraceae bacterium]|nr:hypothetical protein [Lachnospiraceae bacterium]
MKKKIVLLLCVATMACMSFTACGNDSNEPTTEETGEENAMGDPEKEEEDVAEEDLTTENEATEGEEAEVEETNAESVNTEESESGEAVENVAPEDAAAEEAGEATEENVETAE